MLGEPEVVVVVVSAGVMPDPLTKAGRQSDLEERAVGRQVVEPGEDVVSTLDAFTATAGACRPLTCATGGRFSFCDQK